MKKTKLRGELKKIENKNKKFSYKAAIKMLNAINYIYLDIMRTYDYKIILDYDKSKYLFGEIVTQFEYIFNLLNEGKVLMAICLLRNIYEEILYIIATSCDDMIEVDIESNPSDFRNIVKDNCSKLLSDYFESKDISDLYGYLSKLTHITNLKEATSYLSNTKKYNQYISNEIKFITILIEYMYLSFLNKRANSNNEDMCFNAILIAGYIEFINLLYYTANSENSEKYLKKYFHGEKNKKYLKKQSEEMINILNDFKIEKDNISITIKRALKEFNNQLEDSKYLYILDKLQKENKL